MDEVVSISDVTFDEHSTEDDILSSTIQENDSANRSSLTVASDDEQADLNILGEMSSEKNSFRLCDKCSDKTKATLICKNENKSLCNKCGRQHKQELTTKQHVVARLEDNKPICDLCLDSSIPGYGFCTDCKQKHPEVLCLPCSKRHNKTRGFENHKICTELDLMNICERSEDRQYQDHLNENTNAKRTVLLKRSIFPNKTCFVCRKEVHSDINVCTSCKTVLCVDCFPDHHSDSHKTIPVAEFLNHKFKCAVCNIIASYHCRFCGYDFCDDCSVDHQENGLLDHEWVDIIARAFYLKELSVSVHCQCGGKNDVLANSFCVTCTISTPMCDKCSVDHMREFVDHTLCDDMTLLDNKDQQDEEEHSEDKECTIIKCIPCSFENIDNIATSFCSTCTEPEPMCDDCAVQHTRERQSRNHTICQDLELISPHELKIMHCKICQKSGELRTAIAFCTTCEQSEPFCIDCAKMHSQENKSCSHEICYDIQQLNKSVKCEPCSFGSKDCTATHFCMDCKDPEPMCQACAKQHLNHRYGRGHTLCDDISKLLGSEKVTMQSFSPMKENPTGNNQKIPGKPKALKVMSDEIHLFWRKTIEKADYYEVRHKTKDGKEMWKYAKTTSDQNQLSITGLKADTRFTCQVRGVFKNQKGYYGPENDTLKTEKSLGERLLKFSIKTGDSKPTKYRLLPQEQRKSRNLSAKTRKVIFGNPNMGSGEEKTILLVGATGSGKSTLVDGIVNYIMGVNFDDPFRFTLVKEDVESHNQAKSHTEWITVYRIGPQKGSRFTYTLNIIDTPGFGDTRGIERDGIITDQVRHLFSAVDDKGVLLIDAVCFIVKAPDARLTASQLYIFSSITSLFGKDIESNICTLITFADGAKPPVLASLKEANLNFGPAFEFNNSALFAENENLSSTSMASNFWKMGCFSFQKFFDELCRFQTKSLSLTKTVLIERENLKTIIASIFPQVQAGLSKLDELRKQIQIFQMHDDDIRNNKDFEYETEETKQVLEDLSPGHHVTNCIPCNVTCHADCAYADNDDKRKCCVMSNDFCTVCIGKCEWNLHRNAKVIIKYEVVNVKRTYMAMKDKYESARGLKLTHENYIEELSNDVNYIFENVQLMMNEMKACKEKLNKIALRPDPLSTIEHIEMMITSEDRERQPGYENRIRMLYEFKHMAQVEEKVSNFDQNCQETENILKSVTGKSLKGSTQPPKEGFGQVCAKKFKEQFKRSKEYMKNLFGFPVLR